MKNLLNKTAIAILILLCIIVLGLVVPITLTIVLKIITPISWIDCTTSVPFWICTVIGWLVSAIYINEVIKD